MGRGFGVWVLLAFLAVGCGGSGSQSLGPGGGGPGETGVSLRVLLDYEGDATGEQAQRYRLEVLDGNTVVLSRDVDRPEAAPLEVFLSGLPAGTYLLRATGFNTQGDQLGHFEQEIEVVAGSPTAVTVSSIWNPGKTREIGLVSVTTAGETNFADCHECVTNASGRFVLFQSDGLDQGPGLFLRDRLVRTTTRLLTPTPVSADIRALSISADARWFVYRYNGRTIIQDRFLRDFRVFNFPGLVSISPDGNFLLIDRGQAELEDRVTGERRVIFSRGRKPRISADSDTIACTVPALQGEDLAVKVLSSGTSLVFPVGKDILDLQLSGDGNWIAFVEAGSTTGADGPLRLLDVRTGRFTTVTDEAQPGISISQDGLVIAFRSSDANLVFNDLNNRKDLFAWNRRTRLFTRVNVAADDESVFGGVSDFCPPMLSSDGRRVVFLSDDSKLVPPPITSRVAVFSSQVPGAGIVYLASQNRIVRLPNAERLEGNAVIPASAVLFEAPPGTSVGQLYLDVAKDRLFAVVNSSPRGEVRVLNNASTRSANDPSTLLAIPANGVAGDSTRGLVYISRFAPGQILVQSVRSDSNVSLPLGNAFAVAFGPGRVLYVNTRQDEIFLGAQGSLTRLVEASTFNGTPGTFFGNSFVFQPESQLQNVVASVLDPSRVGSFSPETSADFLAISVSGNTGRLAHYRAGTGRGVGGDHSPTKIQPIGVEDSPTPSAQMSFDRFSGMLYVATSKGLLVFNRFAGTPVKAPERVFQLPCQGVVVDRTH